MSSNTPQDGHNTETLPVSKKLSFNAWVKSDVGRVRKNNEDNHLADTVNGLFVVADGMGGHEHGELASLRAVEAIKNYIHNVMAGIKGFMVDPSDERKEWIKKVVNAAIQKANQEVFKLAKSKGVSGNMGTTLSMLLFLNGTEAVIGHVGDSRIYLVRNKEVHQITEDQTLIQQHINQGIVKPEDAANVPYGNTLLQAVGYRQEIHPDVSFVRIQPADQFLLCSDGLSNYLVNDEIVTVFSESIGPQVVPRLIDCANRRGGKDNITAIVLRMEDPHGNEAATQLDLTSGLLSNCAMLGGLASQDVMRFLPIGSLKIFIKDEVLHTEGQESPGLFIVLSGSVGHYVRDTWLFSSGPGQHFGELSLFRENETTMSTAICEEEVRAILFPIDRLRQFIADNPEVGLRLLFNLGSSQMLQIRNQIGRLSQLLSHE